MLSVVLASTTSTALASVVKLYGGDKFSRGISVQQTKDGGFVITGDAYNHGSDKSEVFFVKVDNDGK